MVLAKLMLIANVNRMFLQINNPLANFFCKFLFGGVGTQSHRLMAKRLQSTKGWRVRRNWQSECKFTKKNLFTFVIGISFASTTKLLKILVKNLSNTLKCFKCHPWQVLIKTYPIIQLLANYNLVSLTL